MIDFARCTLKKGHLGLKMESSSSIFKNKEDYFVLSYIGTDLHKRARGVRKITMVNLARAHRVKGISGEKIVVHQGVRVSVHHLKNSSLSLKARELKFCIWTPHINAKNLATIFT